MTFFGERGGALPLASVARVALVALDCEASFGSAFFSVVDFALSVAIFAPSVVDFALDAAGLAFSFAVSSFSAVAFALLATTGLAFSVSAFDLVALVVVALVAFEAGFESVFDVVVAFRVGFRAVGAGPSS